jgi:uridine kinase
MEQIVGEIVELIKGSDKRLIIGISGHGAAGKTRLANELINQLASDVKLNYMNTDPYIITDVRKYSIINYQYKGENHHYKMTACHPATHQLMTLERDIDDT